MILKIVLNSGQNCIFPKLATLYYKGTIYQKQKIEHTFCFILKLRTYGCIIIVRNFDSVFCSWEGKNEGLLKRNKRYAYEAQ